MSANKRNQITPVDIQWGLGPIKLEQLTPAKQYATAPD